MPQSDNDGAIVRRVPGSWPVRLLLRAANDPLTAGGLLVIMITSATIVSNALLLQNGRHPAPLFQTRPFDGRMAVPMQGMKIAVKHPQSIQSAPAALVRDIQVALAEKGLYDGALDGLAGPKTRHAIEAFEKKAGLKVTGEPAAQLLAVLQMSSEGRPAVPLTKTVSTVRITVPVVDVPDNKAARVQTALNDLGYGPIDVDGLMGSETSKAIRRFELDRGLPITGKIGERVIDELVAIGGLASR